MSEPAACPPPRIVYYCPPAAPAAPGDWRIPLGTYTGRVDHDMGGVVPTVQAREDNPPLYHMPAVPLPPAVFLMVAALGALVALAAWRKK
jgi:hypothetical protein